MNIVTHIINSTAGPVWNNAGVIVRCVFNPIAGFALLLCLRAVYAYCLYSLFLSLSLYLSPLSNYLSFCFVFVVLVLEFMITRTFEPCQPYRWRVWVSRTGKLSLGMFCLPTVFVVAAGCCYRLSVIC